MDKKDGLAAIFLLIVAVLGLTSSIILRYPFGSLHNPEIGFFPVILSSLLILFSGILLIKSLKPKLPGGKIPQLGDRWKDLFPAVGSLVGYVLFFKSLGYVVCTFLLVAIFVRLGTRSWKAILLISAISTFSSYALFKWCIIRPLPSGILPF